MTYRGKQAKCVHSVCSQVNKDLLSSCYDGSQTFSYSQKLSVINTVQHSDPLLFQELFSTDQLNRVLCYRSPCSFIRVGNSLFATSLTKNERFARKPKSEFPTLSLIHIKEIQYSYIQYRRFNIIDPKLGVNNISAL